MGNQRFEHFAAYHAPALEANDARHNMLLALIADAAKDPSFEVLHWSFDVPGACAVKAGGRPIVLGDLNEVQCWRLAEETAAIAYSGVRGPDQTARWFVEKASALGMVFQLPIAQRIHVLSEKPQFPGAPGHARLAGVHDAATLVDWAGAFVREAIPGQPIRSRAQIERAIAEEQYML